MAHVYETATNFSRLEGEFRDGKLNGWGVHNNEEWSSSTRDRAYFFRYEGEYRSGRMNGRGTMTTKDGRAHPGMFEDGALVGTNIDIFDLVADIDKSCP